MKKEFVAVGAILLVIGLGVASHGVSGFNDPATMARCAGSQIPDCGFIMVYPYATQGLLLFLVGIAIIVYGIRGKNRR